MARSRTDTRADVLDAARRLAAIGERITDRTTSAAACAHIRESLALVEDALLEIARDLGDVPADRPAHAPYTAAAIGRHVEAARQLAMRAVTGTPVQRGAIARLVADVADDAHRLCVAVCDAHGVLAVAVADDGPVQYAPSVQEVR
jgi:hypothetical protein